MRLPPPAPKSSSGRPPPQATDMEWSGSAWRRLPLAARRPGPWLTRACSPPPPPPRQGRILPGGHGPAPPPASMAGRGGSRSGALRELCSFRFLRLTGVSAPPHPHPAGALRWPSIPVRLRFRRTPGSCVSFQLLGLTGVLAAPVPATRFYASLRILARPGLRPPSHPSPPLFPPSRPPPCPACPFAATLLARPAAPDASFGCGRDSPLLWS